MLGQLEQKIMDILWSNSGPLKPGDVQKKIKGGYAYTTIMTVLKRMTDKKIVERAPNGKCFCYHPTLSKDEFIKSNLDGIFDNLVASYGKLAISQFVDAVKTNKNDLELLKQYLKDN